MKRYLLAVLALGLVGCQIPDFQEAGRLKTENEGLVAQVSTLTKERDAAMAERDDLRGRLQQIKSALENLPSTSGVSITPPAAPDSSTMPVAPAAPAPAVPDSSAAPAAPAAPDSSATPTPDPSAKASTPDSSSVPALPPVSGADATALEKLRKYADDVLTAAQNFKAQTRQEAPNNCVSGYAAGAYNVQKSLDLKECSLIAESNGDYRVTARDASGNSVSVP